MTAVRSICCGAMVFTAAMFASSELYSQVITSVSNNPSHGASLVISGSAFGTKPNPAPVIWDNFETGAFNPKWSQTGYPAGTITVAPAGANARHANSSYNTTTNFRGKDGWATLTGGSDSPSWFIQHWVKLDNDWNWGTSATQGAPNSNLANVKIFRMWTSGSSDENFVMAAHGWENAVIVKTEYIEETKQAVQYTQGGYMQNWTKGVWHLWQFEFKDSDQGVNNGVFRWWIDGQLKFESTTWMTRDTYAAYKRVYGLGFFNSNGDSSTDDNHYYMDDAYIDNTWARVELGDNPNYAACTHREIQIPVSWSPTEITVNVNQGSFQTGQTAYLFVVTSSGVKSAGRSVTIGGEMPAAPGQPGKPVF